MSRRYIRRKQIASINDCMGVSIKAGMTVLVIAKPSDTGEPWATLKPAIVTKVNEASICARLEGEENSRELYFLRGRFVKLVKRRIYAKD